ncbi:MAG: DUF202 domain-containing protein [Bacteroidetes bacterium]|nr:MAG: DUF202 domain-containing protein [Bacteroidota bacterium]
METNELTYRDYLAIERTRLANERTFLAYFRTAVAMLASGIVIFKVEFFENIAWIGLILMGMAPAIFIIGLWRLLYVKRRIKRYYVQ